jgi:hypothetical protein
MIKDEISVIKLPLSETTENYHFYQQPYQYVNMQTQQSVPLQNSEIQTSESIFPNIDLNSQEKEIKEFEKPEKFKQDERKKSNKKKKSLDLNKTLTEFHKIQINYFITVYLLIISASFIISGVILYDSVIKTTTDDLKLLIDFSSFLSILTGTCVMVSIISNHF